MSKVVTAQAMTTWTCLTIAVLTLLVLVTGCSGGNSDFDPSLGITPVELRLTPGDKVRVTVFGEDKLSGEYQIDNGGALSLPLAGTIQATGLTKAELEQAITTQLKSQYLRNPKVTIDVTGYRPFYVLGEVQKPGEYQYRSGVNVLSAIAIAGGATYRANNSKVLIQRAGSHDFTEHAQSPSVLVMPGDVIRVPERFF